MRRLVAGGIVAFALCGAVAARAGVAFPPWSDAADIPIPLWARSVAPHADDIAVFSAPNRVEARRGSLFAGARPALYGAVRGPGCGARWLQIGPAAWVCGDDVELAADDPPPFVAHHSLPPRYTDDGLAFRYAFVGPDGAMAFRDLEHAEEEAPAAELDPGFAVAVVEERDAHGQRWGRTRHGLWIAETSLNVARPVTLHGELLAGRAATQVAWVLPEHAATYAQPKDAKPSGVRLRFDLVRWNEEQKGPAGLMVRVTDDGSLPAAWMRAKDLARPGMAPPPDEVGGQAATARWIDVELATQTLVAYEGTRPVYAALVSTGRGAQGTETATPLGVHRIWVKLETSSMGNLGDEDAETHYSIEDVPYVQFFAKGVALHGAFWHHSFGAAHSHGCVNLAPVDARWLFDFSAPDLPAGWSAVLPAGVTDPGTVVRVR